MVSGTLIGALLGLAVAAAEVPEAVEPAPGGAASPLLRLQRVELLAEEDGSFLVDQLPTLTTRPGPVALRLLAQVQPVLTGRGGRLGLGLSWARQVLYLEEPLSHGLSVGGGLHLRLGLPAGASAGLSWQRGPVRLGLVANLSTAATWAHPRWTGWRVLPGLGLSWVLPGRSSAP